MSILTDPEIQTMTDWTILLLTMTVRGPLRLALLLPLLLQFGLVTARGGLSWMPTPILVKHKILMGVSMKD